MTAQGRSAPTVQRNTLRHKIDGEGFGYHPTLRFRLRPVRRAINFVTKPASTHLPMPLAGSAASFAMSKTYRMLIFE
jgi:hypothetical protein